MWNIEIDGAEIPFPNFLGLGVIKGLSAETDGSIDTTTNAMWAMAMRAARARLSHL